MKSSYFPAQIFDVIIIIFNSMLRGGNKTVIIIIITYIFNKLHLHFFARETLIRFDSILLSPFTLDPCIIFTLFLSLISSEYEEKIDDEDNNFLFLGIFMKTSLTLDSHSLYISFNHSIIHSFSAITVCHKYICIYLFGFSRLKVTLTFFVTQLIVGRMSKMD